MTRVITSNEKSARPSGHAHKLVRETAIAMCGELYDTMMQDNEWYDCWKRANPGANSRELFKRFLARNLSKLLPQARAAMTQILRTSADEQLKESVYEALLLDATLVRGRRQGN